MGEPDTTFCLFFRSSTGAGVLSCDHHGITSDELLHYPLTSFIADADGDVDIGQLRYNLRERHRQKLFRLLFMTRKQIAESGRLRELWEERERLFPDAPGVPQISAIMSKGVLPPVQPRPLGCHYGQQLRRKYLQLYERPPH